MKIQHVLNKDILSPFVEEISKTGSIPIRFPGWVLAKMLIRQGNYAEI